jgi:ABC-2 type transport system ATP-binding protein
MKKSNPTLPAVRQAVATVDNVSRRFGTVVAVDGVSVEIERGETVAVLGPNGAGKTTVVTILLGLLKPDSGVARLFGRPATEAIARGRVGAMLQDAGLPHGARVAELVDLIRGMYPRPLSLNEALTISDLADVAGRQAQRLSGGQRQRLRLAMALAGDPELLVLDEPTAALDVEARRLFWDRMRAVVSTGRTVLFATHRLEEADTVADRVLVLSRGRLVADGTPEQIKARASLQVADAGSDLPGLEDAYLAITRDEAS